MSDFKIFDIAGSALAAQSQRMNLIASNIANADSISSSSGEVYKSRHAVFKTVFDQAGSQIGRGSVAAGVEMAGVVESNAPVFPEFAPNHPMANEDGYIFRSNVNAIEEMANMISASRSFQNNIEVIKSSQRMITSLINMGK